MSIDRPSDPDVHWSSRPEPLSLFLTQGSLRLAATAIPVDGGVNHYADWDPTEKHLTSLYEELSDQEKIQADAWLRFAAPGGYYDMPYWGEWFKVLLPAIPPDVTWHDIVYWTVVCRVCRTFEVARRDLPADCPNCDRTLREDAIIPLAIIPLADLPPKETPGH